MIFTLSQSYENFSKKKGDALSTTVASLRIKILVSFSETLSKNLSIEQLKMRKRFSWNKKTRKTRIHHRKRHLRQRNHRRPSWRPRPCRQPKTAFLLSFL